MFHQYTLDVGGARDAIVADLARGGRRGGIYYPIPVHRQPLHPWSAASTPTCRSPTRAAARTLALPMFPGLTDAEQDQVIEAVRAAVRDRGRERRERAADGPSPPR